MIRTRSLLLVLSNSVILVFVTLLVSKNGAAQTVDFNRDIRPILSDTCFKCHGPDEEDREADLRLDQKESVFAGSEVVVPFELDDSELFERLITDDEYSKMPPPDSGRVLTDEQIDLFRRWIEQGANWDEHWSFVAPVQSSLPTTENKSWPRNEIDHFVLAELESNQLSPNSSANRQALIRRVTLDLIGLPPTPEQVDAFVKDEKPEAYERLVDRLLASASFGEHQARFWLDAARYGDTHGLHLDNYREMWLYRDWVINAFNENKPYDEFVIEQLAGDLLPDPTQDQLIATGFNRAHVTTNEGGSIKQEVFVRNVIDRVETTGTVFMGLTVGCAACHDHKYDPISQKEFYQLFAYFNSLDADPMDGNAKVHAPTLSKPTQKQSTEIAEVEKEISQVAEAIASALAEIEYVEPELEPQESIQDLTEFIWIDDQIPDGAKPNEKWKFESKDVSPVLSGKVSSKGSSGGFHQHFFTGAASPLRVAEGDKLFGYVFLDPENPPQQIMFQWNDGNWEHRVYWGESIINFGKDNSPSRLRMGDLPKAGEWVRLEIPVEKVNLGAGSLINGWAFSQVGGTVHWDKAGIVSSRRQSAQVRSFAGWLKDQRLIKGNGLPGNLKAMLAESKTELDEKQLTELRNHFLQEVFADTRATFQPMQIQLEELNKKKTQIEAMIPTTLVYRETKEPREAFLLERGLYDQPGEKVERDVPAILPSLPSESNNRLALANWLTDLSHPLTARVQVNRLWQQFFGTGLVESAEDFGAQGTWPSHPELLDWMAVDFVESGWDVKRMLKKIAMSSTYQQSAKTTSRKTKVDPSNRLLSRGPRFRLDAERLRDQALAVSGLLVEKVGGPSVKPPQPDGLWFVVGYSGSNTVRFKSDKGHENVHRRSLYTFWKRTAPPPQMSILDAPSRESCTVRRERTNTPLQALMLMNDPQFVESSRHFAQLIIEQASDDKTRIGFMFHRSIGRSPTADEANIFLANLRADRKDFDGDIESAKKLVSIGDVPADLEEFDAAELAAWTLTANLMMNTDEFLNK